MYNNEKHKDKGAKNMIKKGELILTFIIICLLFSIFGIVQQTELKAAEKVYPIWYKIFTENSLSFAPTLSDDVTLKLNEKSKAVEFTSKESDESPSWDPYMDYYGLNYSSGIFEGNSLVYNEGITVAARVFIPETVVVENPDLTFGLRGTGSGNQLLNISQKATFTEKNAMVQLRKVYGRQFTLRSLIPIKLAKNLQDWELRIWKARVIKIYLKANQQS